MRPDNRVRRPCRRTGWAGPSIEGGGRIVVCTPTSPASFEDSRRQRHLPGPIGSRSTRSTSSSLCEWSPFPRTARALTRAAAGSAVAAIATDSSRPRGVCLAARESSLRGRRACPRDAIRAVCPHRRVGRESVWAGRPGRVYDRRLRSVPAARSGQPRRRVGGLRRRQPRALGRRRATRSAAGQMARRTDYRAPPAGCSRSKAQRCQSPDCCIS